MITMLQGAAVFGLGSCLYSGLESTGKLAVNCSFLNNFNKTCNISKLFSVQVCFY